MLSSTVIHLAGGLGNQLFGYAFGQYLREIHCHEVVFDLADLPRTGIKPQLTIADLYLPGEFLVVPGHVNLAKKILSVTRVTGARNHNSRNPGYDGSAERISKSALVSGYFQSWRYFAALENLRFSRDDLLRESNATDWFRHERRLMIEERPIVVHVRRGDYAKVPGLMGLLSAEYFVEAVASIRAMGLDNPLWVFSDDPLQAEHLLRPLQEEKRFVRPQSHSFAHESLVLMSHGIGHVISNSTFSWWAATLSSESQQVVAPSPWFQGLNDPIDILPKNWATVASRWSSA